MFIANGDLLALQQHLSELVEMDISAKVNFYIAKLVRVLGREIKDVADALEAIIRKYGEDKGGGVFTLTPPNNSEGKPASENWEVFVKERQELLDAESDVDCKVVILPQDAKVSVSVLLAFDRFLKVEGIEG